jgi:apolipoprotein D and lipocalin family protein
MTTMRLICVLALAFLLSGCTGLPEGVTPVRGFDLDRYLGKWYEIARLDHSFERGLQRVTAEYMLRDDGGVSVVNRGYSAAEDAWSEVEGKAYFVGSKDVGHLKVSFFGPFYASYVVFALDAEDYQYAFVAGYDRSYLWLLARTPVVSDDLLTQFITLSGQLGFDTDKLVFVEH